MKSEVFDDGSEVLVVALYKPDNIVQINFWQGTTAVNPMEDDDLWTPALWETYMLGVHDEEFVSSTCGNDQWLDNHYSFDCTSDCQDVIDISVYADQADKLGLKYHWWSVGPVAQLYVSDPTGWMIQFGGMTSSGPSYKPTYSADCKSDDGCEGRGYCNNHAINFVNWLTS